MTDDEPVETRGWRFPADLEVPGDDQWYRIKFGDNVVKGFSWPAHVDLLHQRDVRSIETEVVDSGFSPDGIQYAAVKATVVMDDGHSFSSLQAADETTNQVRDPEYVWSVAESRALKRAVKKALNIVPVDEGTTQSVDEEAGSTGRTPPTPPAMQEDEEDEPESESNVEIHPEPADDDLDW